MLGESKTRPAVHLIRVLGFCFLFDKELARLRDENRRLKSEASKNHQKSRSASERLVIGGFEKLDTETEDATAKVNAESSKVR